MENGQALIHQGDEPVSPAVLEQVLAGGDISKLSAKQRLEYLQAVCRSVGLNPLTRPIEFINLSGRVVPYAKKECTDQLRQLRRISITIVSRVCEDGIYTVTARATTPDGRTDEDVGSVVVANLKGDHLANATMKAHTKAKRRVTLSICGLSILDESELDTVTQARPLPMADDFDVTDDGEVLDPIEETDEQKVERWRVKINDAQTRQALTDVAKAIKAEPMSDFVKLALTSAYNDRAKALKGAA